VLTKARILKRQASHADGPEAERILNEALVYANRSISLLPGKAEPIYNKACYQALLGLDRNEVLNNLKAAFRLNPALKQIAATDTDLDSMRQNADFNQLVAPDRPANA
jgi:hypothetical protein